MSVRCWYENKQRAEGKLDYLRDLPEEEKHPDFRFTI